MKKFDNIFLAIAIVIAICMCIVVINWLGWVGIAVTIAGGIIVAIIAFSIWCSAKQLRTLGLWDNYPSPIINILK